MIQMNKMDVLSNLVMIMATAIVVDVLLMRQGTTQKHGFVWGKRYKHHCFTYVTLNCTPTALVPL
jgi:hypothetical protein